MRSLFAFIESTIYNQKQLAKHVDTALKTMRPIWAEVAGLSQLELLAMEEKTFQIKDDGTVKDIDSFVRFRQNFKFSFEVLAKCCGSDFRPIYQNSKGWDSLQKALAVRDRLMHPKKVVDLDVTPNEFKEAQRASDWFASVFRIALHSHQASFFTLLGAFTDENSLLEKAQRMKQELPSMKEQLNEREKH